MITSLLFVHLVKHKLCSQILSTTAVSSSLCAAYILIRHVIVGVQNSEGLLHLYHICMWYAKVADTSTLRYPIIHRKPLNRQRRITPGQMAHQSKVFRHKSISIRPC